MPTYPNSADIESLHDPSAQGGSVATLDLPIASNEPEPAPLRAVELTDEKDQQMDQATENAQARLDEQFPHGHIPIFTESTNLLCGLFAIRESIRSQYPEVPAPDIQDLRAIANMPKLNIRSRNTYTDSELARILQEWAKSRGYEDFVLAYIVEEGFPFLSGYGPADDTAACVLWIHNDNAEVVFAGSDVPVVNHWSGVQSKPAPAPPSLQTDVAQAATSEAYPVPQFLAYSGTEEASVSESQGEEPLSEPLPHPRRKQPQKAQNPSTSSAQTSEPRRSKRNVKSSAKVEYQQQQPQDKTAKAPRRFRLLCPMTDCDGGADTLTELNRHGMECHKGFKRFESAQATKVEFLPWLNGDTKASVPPETRALHQYLLADTPSNSISAHANTTTPALKREATKAPAQKSSTKSALGQGRVLDRPATEQEDAELQRPSLPANSAAGIALPAISSIGTKRKREDRSNNIADSAAVKQPRTQVNATSKSPRIILRVTDSSRQVEIERKQNQAVASEEGSPTKAYQQTRGRSRSQPREAPKISSKSTATRSQATNNWLPTVHEESEDVQEKQAAPTSVGPSPEDVAVARVLPESLTDDLSRPGEKATFEQIETRPASAGFLHSNPPDNENHKPDDVDLGSEEVSEGVQKKVVRPGIPELDSLDNEDAGDERGGSIQQSYEAAVSAGGPIRRSSRRKGEFVSMYGQMQFKEKKRLEAIEEAAQDSKAVPWPEDQSDYTRWGQARLELVGNGNYCDLFDASILDRNLADLLDDKKKKTKKKKKEKKKQFKEEKEEWVTNRVKEICHSDGIPAPIHNDGKNIPKNATRDTKIRRPKVIWSDYPDIQANYEEMQNSLITGAQLAPDTSESSIRDKYPGGVPPPSANVLSDAHPDPIPRYWEEFEKTDKELQGALWAVIAKPFLTEATRAVEAGSIKTTKKQPPKAKKPARQHADHELEEDTQENSQEESQEEPQAEIKTDATEKMVNMLLLAATAYIANLQRTHGVLTQEHDTTLREKEDEIAALTDRHPDGKALRIKDTQIARMKNRRRQYKMTRKLERQFLIEEHVELRKEKLALEQEKQKIEEERKKLEEEKRELKEQRRDIEEDRTSSGD